MINFDRYDVTNKKWITVQASVEEDDIRNTCQKKSIQALVEHKINTNKLVQQIKDVKQDINNNDQLCLTEIKGMV